MSYTFITFRGQKYAFHESSSVLEHFSQNAPFDLMPLYTPEERAKRKQDINEQIESRMSYDWAQEKEMRKRELELYKSTLTSKQAKETKKRVYKIANKEEWKKAWRETTRKIVEIGLPQISVDDFKNPLENVVFQQVIFKAFNAGVEEETLDLFVSRCISLRKSSKEASDMFFSYFAHDASRLKHFALFDSPQKNVKMNPIVLSESWMIDLMNERLFSPRNTGRGELGAFALFKGNIDFISFDERGDFLAYENDENKCAIEVKSIQNRKMSIRLGSETTWPESKLFEMLMKTSLRNSALSKFVSRNLLEKHEQQIKDELNMSINQFLDFANEELRNILRKYDKICVFVENENAFEEVDIENTHFYGISSEGRWKFTLAPNNLFKKENDMPQTTGEEHEHA